MKYVVRIISTPDVDAVIAVPHQDGGEPIILSKEELIKFFTDVMDKRTDITGLTWNGFVRLPMLSKSKVIEMFIRDVERITDRSPEVFDEQLNNHIAMGLVKRGVSKGARESLLGENKILKN